MRSLKTSEVLPAITKELNVNIFMKGAMLGPFSKLSTWKIKSSDVLNFSIKVMRLPSSEIK